MKMLLNPNPLEAKQDGSGVAPTQGARRATGGCATASDRRDLDISPPDPEVTEEKPRRRFTAAYKLRVIDQADHFPREAGAKDTSDLIFHRRVISGPFPSKQPYLLIASHLFIGPTID